MEAFLTCALLPAPIFQTHSLATAEPMHQIVGQVERMAYDEEQKEHFLRALLLNSEFLGHTQRRQHQTPGRTLVVDGQYPELVRNLRSYGVDAFGLSVSHNQILTPFHAIGEPGLVPFLPDSFYVVYWITGIPHPHGWLDVLRDVVSAIEQQGFLIFDPEEILYPWEVQLKEWKWDLLPFKIDGLQIWQKPFRGNVVSISKKLAYWTIRRGPIQLPVGTKGPNAIARSA